TVLRLRKDEECPSAGTVLRYPLVPGALTQARSHSEKFVLRVRSPDRGLARSASNTATFVLRAGLDCPRRGQSVCRPPGTGRKAFGGRRAGQGKRAYQTRRDSAARRLARQFQRASVHRQIRERLSNAPARWRVRIVLCLQIQLM